MGIIRDITEKRWLLNHLQQTKKLQAVTEMASGIAHDFNNMLTSVVGFISLAKMNLKAGRPAIQELEKAENIALRSSELSDTLITFSRGNKPIKKKVPITAFLKRSLHLMKTRWPRQFTILSEMPKKRCPMAVSYSLKRNDSV